MKFQIFAIPDEPNRSVLRRVARQTKELEMSCSPEELIAGIDRWKAGGYIQDIFPHLPAGEREFLMTGITPAEWDEIFGKED